MILENSCNLEVMLIAEIAETGNERERTLTDCELITVGRTDPSLKTKSVEPWVRSGTSSTLDKIINTRQFDPIDQKKKKKQNIPQ